MSAPTIAQRGSYPVEVTEGEKYAWCSCGLSGKQPFCDGSHAGTGFSPVVFKAEKTGKLWLCGCKHSQKGQFCDGSHSRLP